MSRSVFHPHKERDCEVEGWKVPGIKLPRNQQPSDSLISHPAEAPTPGVSRVGEQQVRCKARVILDFGTL